MIRDLPPILFWSLAFLALPALAGCESIIGAKNRGECVVDEDCPIGERCVDASRCRPHTDADDSQVADADSGTGASGDGGLGGLFDDAEPPDAHVVDAAAPPPDAAAADATVGSVDPCGQPVSRVDAPRPESDSGCFRSASDRAWLQPDGATFVPHAVCTPYGLYWLGADEDGAVRPHLRHVDDEGPPDWLGPEVSASRAVAGGRYAVLETARETEGGGTVRNAVRVDLALGGRCSFIAPRDLDQWSAARATDRTAFTQTRVDGTGTATIEVVIHQDAGGESRCGADGRVQWGVGLGPVRAAWFERRAGRPEVDVVLTTGADCVPRIAWPAGGRVDADARMVLTDRFAAWVVETPDHRRVAMWLDLDALGEGPRRWPASEDDAGIVEVAGRGDRLAVVRYRPGGHAIDLFRVDDGQRTIVGEGNALRPSVGADAVLWAEQRGTEPWELRHVQLR